MSNKVNRIHHMGFIVENLDETLRVWEQLFHTKAEIKVNDDLQVRLGSMIIGGVKFVFNESTAPGSRWDTFLKTHGEGLEHIAFEVTDIDDALRDGGVPEPEGALRRAQADVRHAEQFHREGRTTRHDCGTDGAADGTGELHPLMALDHGQREVLRTEGAVSLGAVRQ